MKRLLVTLLCALLLSGCQSMRSWSGGCADVYSGVRYSREIRPTVPVDGKLFFILDLLPTTLLDTLALPVTVFAEPSKPPGGFAIGCQWAKARARER